MSDLNSKSQRPPKTTRTPGRSGTQSPAKTERGHRPFLPHTIRIFAVPIILGWVFVTVLVNVIVPAIGSRRRSSTRRRWHRWTRRR